MPIQSNPAVERPAFTFHGFLGLILGLILLGIGAGTIWLAIVSGLIGLIAVGVVIGIAGLVTWGGMFILQPNQAMVLVFLGKYTGTVRGDGWHWVNPFTRKQRISLRVHNFNSDRLKVNDEQGNPIEIAAVVVWRVIDTARAEFDVENYGQFVNVQSETAIRHLATRYPYDNASAANATTLRGSSDEVAKSLQQELQSRLGQAGIQVIEARLTHLAYSPEIAGAMLQRQQAQAIVAARQQIVAGAVGMVELVLESLRKKKIVDLTAQQKADVVSNLLVVLTSDRGAQPVLSTTPRP
jgi:regulator of protease activity HflC (stomatin/prohibitin superfamily)